MIRRRWTMAAALGLTVMLAAGGALGADWPTWRHDAARSGITDEQLPAQLHRQWTWEAGGAPMPAWPEPGKEMHRIPFDYAYQVAAAGGMIYFGSSGDHQVHALDAATGRERWSFFTGGPVRFAPYVADGKVYVGSDDGHLYCLGATDGAAVWQQRPGPSDELIVGNGQLCLRWPPRTGVVVQDGTCYYTAGMWPAEGIYVCAVRASDGQVGVVNDTAGQMYMKFPHPTAEGISGVAPQGHLVVYRDRVLVPTGRSLPAGFDRDTLDFLYYRPSEFLRDGGSWTCAAHGMIIAPRHGGGPDIDVRHGEAMPSAADGLRGWDIERGDLRLDIAGKHCCVFDDSALYASGSGTVGAYEAQAILARKKPADCVIWETPHERAYALIKVGDAIIVGGAGTVTVLSAADGSVLSKLEVPGQARGLAVADGKLLVSTSTGAVVCFGGAEVGDAPTITREPAPVTAAPAIAALAQRILAQTGVTAGYCLDLSSDGARLACELAQRSDLVVYGIEPDAQRVAAAREVVAGAGLYGARVAVHQGTPGRLAHPAYFADLIVAGPGFDPVATGASSSEVYRALSPCDGQAYFATGAASAQALTAWLRQGGVPEGEVTVEADAIRVARGPLPGAGSWTHQYGDAGKSGASDDERVRWPMRLLWFGGPGPELMISRHWRPASPVAANGRLFIAGQHDIIAIDAYTGRELWKRDVRSVGRRAVFVGGGNVAIDDDSVYAATGTVCFRLDAATGEDRFLYRLPTAAPTFTLEQPRSFEVQVDDTHSGQVTVAATAQGLSVTLASVDDMVTNLHRADGPAEGETWAQFIERLTHDNEQVMTASLGDAWELFLDLRPADQRGGPYGRGVFQTIVVPATGEEDVVTAKPAAGEVHPQLEASGDLTDDGSTATVLLPWSEMEAMMGERPASIALGVTLNSSDDGDKLVAANYCFANADSYRLTNGWATLILDPAAAVAAPTGDAALLPAELNETHVWGYPAVTEDTVIGTAGTVPQAQYVKYWSSVGTPPDSTFVFALNKADGSPRWVYEAKRVVGHNMIVVGDGRLYLVDRTSPSAVAAAQRRGETLQVEESLVALDLATGAVLWETSEGLAGRTHLCYAEGVLLADSNQAMTAYNPDGTVRWTRAARTSGRFPVIASGVIYAEPGAYDLSTGEPARREHPLTGEEIDWSFRRAYGCGSISGAPNLLFFRSGAVGIYDLAGDTGVHNFGAVRAGCYINVIAANGLVLAPNADSACTCAYNFQTSLALEPAPMREEDWSIFSVPTSASARIRHARLNLGAPGDRRDAGANVWLCVPRPIFPSTVRVPMAVEVADGGGWFRVNADQVSIAGTDKPWVYASACEDVRRAALDLTYDRPIYCAPCEQPPVIDGSLDDACWQDAEPLTLTDDSALTNPRASALLRRTPEAVVLGLHVATTVREGQAVAWKAGTTGEDAPVWTDESWLVLISDGPRKQYLRLGVSLNARYDALCNYERTNDVDVSWNGDWRSATAADDEGWTAELSVPLEMIRSAGLAPDTMRLNLFHFNSTPVGPRQVRLVYPGTYGWAKCSSFKYLTFEPPTAAEPGTFDVTLHFAELQDLQPGQRVFDIRLQGRTVAESFDIAREAGGGLTALARTFTGVQAAESIEIELVPSGATEAGPALNAIEVHEK
ncbi:MAG TPA: PQQ-binding-like beta-propeller repeat protein [Armatimonadota bacterium]|nr:PQQ-binding-like beta-propeller repeat protein [Armatimonadota bacterium]